MRFSQIKNIITQSYKTGLLQYYLAVAAVILMPVYHWYLTPFMILWGIIWVIDIRRNVKKIAEISGKQKLLFLFFMAFIIWQVAGLFYTNNLKDGVRNITLRLPLLLFPLVLISPGERILRHGGLLLRIFAISTFAYIIFCFGYAVVRSVTIQDGAWIFNPHPPEYDWLNYFYGAEFAAFQHASYLSMFVILSAFIASELFLDKSISLSNRSFWLLVAATMLISIYLLSSRAAILAAILAILLYLTIRMMSSKQLKFRWVGIPLIAILLVVVLTKSPRVYSFIHSSNKDELILKTMNESRLDIWKVTLRLIKDNFILGVGTGDIQDKLNEEYKMTGEEDLLSVRNLNTHNQFIEVLAENGIIGFLLFLGIFFSMGWIAVLDRNVLYLLFIIIIVVSFFFETMLNRLAGLAFFAFFSVLFVHLNKSLRRFE